MLRVLDFAHHLLTQALPNGGYAIDATAGNGHDTVHLAAAVGTAGRVWGFDVQPAALAATRQRLVEAGLGDRAILIEAGHETMASHVPPDVHGRVYAVAFNLGYLPGSGRKALITRPETTLPALDAAAEMLAPGGVMTVVVYTGHPGGTAEAEAVEAWACARPPDRWRVLRYAFVNVPRRPPYLIAVQRQ